VNLLEFAVLAAIVLSALRGYFRGFFRELFGLAAWLGAGAAGYLLGPLLGPAVAAHFGLSRTVGDALAAVGTFTGLFFACQIAGWILYRLARVLYLGPVDRAAGLVLGAAKAIVISALFCMVVTSRRGMPSASERVHDSPMLTALVQQGWDLFAVLRESTGLRPLWQHPYSKMEIEARDTLRRFLTPKPTDTPPPRPGRTPTGAPQ
jgi:membrane protein required for colicin V production